jgi:hypothetical protein
MTLAESPPPVWVGMFVHGALFLAISRTSDAAIPLVSSSANGDEARSNPNVLCYACSRMEFHDVSHEELKEWGYEAKISIDQLTFMVDYYTNERDGSGKRCDLCLVLRQDHYTNRWFPCLIEVIHDLFDDLKTNRQLAIDTAKFERGPRHSSRVIAYSLGIGGTFQPQQVPRLYDPSRAQSCLDNCKAHHNKACNQKTLTVEVMRLIDWERIEIVEARPVGSWLALSYVWGSKVTGGFSRRSKTVIDAIEVTKQLGYRYMWVEEYCIDQDDPVHKGSQIRQMNRIYQGADLTIVAAAGHSKHFGLSGVSSERLPRYETVRVGDNTIFRAGKDPITDLVHQSKW